MCVCACMCVCWVCVRLLFLNDWESSRRRKGKVEERGEEMLRGERQRQRARHDERGEENRQT